ncbi:hypothetical protein Tco_0765478 [Tanacetum coccineum]
MSRTVVYTGHSALKYLFSKHDAKPRLIRWVLLLQEFTIEIKDKRGSENLAVNHLFRLENPELEELDEDAIRDSFPDEHLMVVNIKEAENDAWYTNYANFLVSKIVPKNLTYHLRKKNCLMLRNTYGTTYICLNHALMGLSDDVSLERNYTKFSNIAIQDLLEGIMGPISPPGKFSNQDSIGPPFLRIPPDMFENVMPVKGQEIFPPEIRCP